MSGPSSAEHPGFESDIRPLFRPKDVESMMGHFDLSSYDDVKANADAIYSALDGGNMPCDGAWPANEVSTFRSWMDAGYPK
ncbi:MAG TPA: hypothetical protein VNV44_13180 [Solirubrobacteraceae bacterium]|jgi:hypothetical protein|nr:hypothetical protein [Solirubrobacteraceae bacterium]